MGNAKNEMNDWIKEIQISDLPDKHREMAEIVSEIVDSDTALKIVMRITEHFGKMGMYLPGLGGLIRRKKEEYISKYFDGSNHCDLARATGYSERWVYEILKVVKKDERQATLFEDEGCDDNDHLETSKILKQEGKQ